MPRVNVYLSDDLANEARSAGLNVSSITQEALRRELTRRQSSTWLARVRKERREGVDHENVLAALDAVRVDAGDHWPTRGK